MTISTFSLPIDIPWRRIAFSPDMMDRDACNREYPLRWRSSVAVFEYQPPEDQQRVDGFILSYLKVACTITGFQAYSDEIRMRERLDRSGWTNKEFKDKLGEMASQYYPCYGAILEVVVAPHPDSNSFTLDNYPYFADFDPKKRELYEMVSDTGEVMSRSLEDVNVRLGQTTLSSHEVRDDTTLGGELGVSFGAGSNAISGKGSASNTSGTKDLSQQSSENVRTTDAAREARETFSHTTQLSQMYHQLDSYHLGTNRAAFFMLPRPHVVQSEHTFVNGPRQIEGIQEFMLAVVRPKEMEIYCVEAYLETAHLTGIPILSDDPSTVQLVLPPIIAPITEDDNRSYYENHVVGSASFNAPVDKVIDMVRGQGGYDIGTFKATGLTKVTWDVAPDHVTVNGEAIGRWQDNKTGGDLFPASLELTANVYLKNKVPVIVGNNPGLMITGRSACSCRGRLVLDQANEGPSIVYEKYLASPNEQKQGQGQDIFTIREANQLVSNLKREMLQSVSSADRYPRGSVGLLDTQLFTEMMGTHIRGADREVNQRLVDYAGIDKQVAQRVAAYDPTITRAQLLAMPLPQQVERYGLSFAEAVKMRRALADLAAPVGLPPVPARVVIRVPDLTGLRLEEARTAILTAGLGFGSVDEVDSPLPSSVVTKQSPQPGTEVYAEAEVKLEIASGLSVCLPNVLDLPLGEALCQLRDAGLKSEPEVEGAVRPDTFVRVMEPSPRSWVTPHARIILLMGSHSREEEDYRR